MYCIRNEHSRQVYTLQKLCSFNYPCTLREIKKGGMKALLREFGLVESVIKNIEAMITEYSRTPTNTMCNIKNERKKSKTAATTNIGEYISAVIPYPDSEDEQEDKLEDEKQESGDGYDVALCSSDIVW
ncbi:hypothetical protein PS15m_007823 [Mucor circinelloides]